MINSYVILQRIFVSSLPLHMQLHKETVRVTVRSSRPTATSNIRASYIQTVKNTINNSIRYCRVKLILDTIIYSDTYNTKVQFQYVEYVSVRMHSYQLIN